ncbi:MAG: hypothetical protein B6I20_05525, partial [Bacteroidetes bacterium 4572_117]
MAKEIVTNRHGLAIEIENFYHYESRQFLIDLHNTAKILLYRNKKKLLPKAEEMRQILAIESLGEKTITKMLNSPGFLKKG